MAKSATRTNLSCKAPVPLEEVEFKKWVPTKVQAFMRTLLARACCSLADENKNPVELLIGQLGILWGEAGSDPQPLHIDHGDLHFALLLRFHHLYTRGGGVTIFLSVCRLCGHGSSTAFCRRPPLGQSHLMWGERPFAIEVGRGDALVFDGRVVHAQHYIDKHEGDTWTLFCTLHFPNTFLNGFPNEVIGQSTHSFHSLSNEAGWTVQGLQLYRTSRSTRHGPHF